MKAKPLTVFWGNKRVSHEAILGKAQAETRRRMVGETHVLLVQDTTSFNFSHHPATEGMGDGEQTGLRDKRHERAFAEKESYKWVDGLPSADLLPETVQPIVVCDAEAHIYEFLDEIQARGLDHVIRAADYRSFTPEGQAMFVAVGEKAVHWLLLTALPVESTAQSQQITTWYSYRWLVERFHYVLKSGCKLEESQLRQEVRLERLLAVYTLVAWRLLWLTYQARVTPDAPCTVALQQAEWQAIYLFTQRQRRLPTKPLSLRQAVRWIGQLGGFLGRTGDGEPGIKVLWRGWTRLQDIVTTFTTFTSRAMTPLKVGHASRTSLLPSPSSNPHKMWVIHSSLRRGIGGEAVCSYDYVGVTFAGFTNR